MIKILLVDDDDVDRMSFKRLLKKAGVDNELVEVRDGKEAIDMLMGLVFDCVFLDYQLPGEDGLGVLVKIRRENITTPIIMLTGQGDERLAVEMLHAGASEYLPKSQLSPETLTASLEHALRMHQTELARNQAEEALKENQRTLTTLMGNLPGMAYRCHNSIMRALEFASEGCEELTGHKAEKFMSRVINYGDLIHFEDKDHVWTEIQSALQKNNRYEFNYRIFTANGDEKWVWEQGCGVYSRSGDVIALEGFILDVTDQKLNETKINEKNQALEILKNSLEDKVVERTRDLEDANKKLHKLNQTKSEFLSIVSHELRTPLTSIKSFAEILKEDIEDIEPDTCKEYLSIIDGESDRLERLISNLLDLQKIDAGKMTWHNEGVNLKDLCNKVMGVFQGACKEKNVSLSLVTEDDHYWAYVDTDKVQQVITNLLSNSLKFTDDGGLTIGLERKLLAQGQKMIQISVADTGIGIPEQELDKVFDRFHQVDQSQTRKYSGTGLGLGICYNIVRHYKGRIWAESQLGKGSTFIFTLPEMANASKGMETEEGARVAQQ
ncbi:MAG: hypothetical protein BMS9Abin36_1021 [Gammaproteobacteria bacterium]|nr:MAG: hypothetical protein BMS9Abin36_1021 [Gammaproteobacteria bacterium]